ncbi:hypothetical protein [Jannaschia sp. 2305UL9-9]|uniref:hypothetical protein n=1 Tax=Jannaschia sp. 2305UL9-9 TaxID=3121638 RepID=UPI003529C737
MTEIQTSAEAMEAAALPRAAELRAGGCDPTPAIPKSVAKRSPATKSPAEWAYQRIVLYLKAFEETLEDGQEVAMGFTGGAAGVLRIEGIGFSAPDLVTFSGRDTHGQRCQQLQHVSQINVILRAVPRPENQPEPTRIGFRLARALEEAEDDAAPGADT